MASVYPGSLDSLSTAHIDNVGEPVHNSTINDLADAVNKIEAALGTNPLKGGFVHSVKRYDAVGDGVANDQAAIQAALTAAGSAGGGIVYFPPGKYLVNSQLTVPSFVTLQGPAGVYRSTEYGIDPSQLGAMIVGPSVTTFDLIKNSDTTNGNTAINIRDLWIGVGSSTTADVAAVVFNKVRRSTIKDCYFRGAVTTSRYGLRYMGTSEHCAVVRSQFEGCGIVSEANANLLRVEGCEIGQGGIRFLGGFDHRVTGCDIYQDGIGAGVAFAAYPNGIYVVNVTEGKFLDNHLVAIREHGITLRTGCVSCLVQSNVVLNSSQEVTNTWYGIVVDSDTAASPSTDNIITNNRCYNRGGTTQKYGIGVGSASGTQTNGNLIADNIVTGNNTGGLNVFTAGLTNTYRNNVGFVTEASGSASKQNGNTITHGLAGTPTSVNVNSAVAKHTVTVTAVGATTFTIGLHDDTGTAIVVNETIYWSASYAPA